MVGGVGSTEVKYHIVNFAEDSGEHAVVDETTSMLIFIAPVACEILEIGLGVTTAVVAHSTNHWTINITNQTGDIEILSDDFDTDSDNSGNGGRALTADTLNIINDNGAGDNYLQNAILGKGDMLKLTATKAASATDLAFPMFVIKYRP